MAGRPDARFPAALRVKKGRDFDRAYALRERRDFGALVVYGVPNDLPLARLGLSVSRRVGCAVVRNRFKRLLREAFRMHVQGAAAGLDLVVVVRPHTERPLAEYAARLQEAVDAFRARAAKRAAAAPPAGDAPSHAPPHGTGS
jgi:ribonuclease P protein component